MTPNYNQYAIHTPHPMPNYGVDMRVLATPEKIAETAGSCVVGD